MAYRIKMIQKYDGQKLFVPEFRKRAWVITLFYEIIFSPVMFLLWIMFDREKRWADISGYFNMWHGIKYDKRPFALNGIYEDKANAELAIKLHKEDAQHELDKRREAEYRI